MVSKRRPKVEKVNPGQKLNAQLYLFVMGGLFPLFFLNQYERIGTLKFMLFWYSSIVFLGMGITWLFIRRLEKGAGEGGHSGIISVNGRRFYYLKLSFMDRAMLAYGACVLMSFLFSGYKEFALKGAVGWEMGLYTQLILLGLYWLLSRQKIELRPVLAVHFTASGLVFLLGILHRFDIDPLGFYVGLSVLQKQEFLSTIGQATWYSSYVCTVFMLGVVIFYLSEKFWIRLGTGVYTILSFATLVTQNSDSAFLSIGAVMLLLGCFSLSERKRLLRFCELMALLWGTFGGMGILQRVFSHRMIPLDTLSLFFSQSIFIWVLFALSLAGCVYLEKREKERMEEKLFFLEKSSRVILPVLGVGVLAAVAFIYLNTRGYLLNWFGYQSANPYLYFDYHWGNNRGLSWMVCWQQFWQLPFLHKLFGVGPDCFSPYLYSVPKAAEQLKSLWGNLTLANAHNEYLNHLLCYGLLGLGAWLSVLIGGIRYFYEKAKEEPYFIALALCILSYACHNLFCYQQVCCTPFLFLLIGIGEGLTKWGKSPTIIRKKDNRKKKRQRL